MIGRLLGTIADRFDDGTAVVDVGGVGYEVFVPFGALARLPYPPEQVLLQVHTHVREDALTLYGFESVQDRHAFRVLIGVSGIGPKLALSVLSVLDARALAHAVTAGDASRLRAIPGVGKKTSERILLELKDKMHFLHTAGAPLEATGQAPGPTGVPVTGLPRGKDFVVQALVQMGYKLSEAERAVSKLPASIDDKPVEALLREALALLA